jgi:hypothetical protein
MEGLDFWRLCDELNIVQAALLVAGADPSCDAGYVENWDIERRPVGYEAAKAAISSALMRGTIIGKMIPIYKMVDFDKPYAPEDGSVDVMKSRVDVESLRTWLEDRGVRTGFFFPEQAIVQDYLDPKHPRYAPKLAAAVLAWLAIDDESALKGKTPKQALSKWLREQAARFGMTDEDGKPNETGIEEAAKVANWQPGGGAPKTPGG